jgi:hypothetical protein
MHQQQANGESVLQNKINSVILVTIIIQAIIVVLFQTSRSQIIVLFPVVSCPNVGSGVLMPLNVVQEADCRCRYPQQQQQAVTTTTPPAKLAKTSHQGCRRRCKSRRNQTPHPQAPQSQQKRNNNKTIGFRLLDIKAEQP